MMAWGGHSLSLPQLRQSYDHMVISSWWPPSEFGRTMPGLDGATSFETNVEGKPDIFPLKDSESPRIESR
jgi:hypothetical protein